VRQSAVVLYLSQRLAWSGLISRHLQHSLPTNTPSPPQGMTAIHTRVSTEYLLTWSILTAASHATGPEISASRWHSCARAILHCWQPICTVSDVENPPLVHIAMALMRWQNIWCYSAQHMTRRGESHGQISTTKATQDSYGASWRGSGRWPIPPTGNERERKQQQQKQQQQAYLNGTIWSRLQEQYIVKSDN